MFKVDRKSASAVFISKPGTYNVTITEIAHSLNPKGENVATLKLETANQERITDDLLNRETVYWKLNQLLAACPKVNIEEGKEIDLTKTGVFAKFCDLFKGQKLDIVVEEEAYTAKDGTPKKICKVKRFQVAANTKEDDVAF